MQHGGATLLLIAAMVMCVGEVSGEENDLEALTNWMTGSFSSHAQAQADSSYYDIRLEMVPIWRDRIDGAWLYVEQAMEGHRDRPYRQRVYRLSLLENGALMSEVFTMPDPLRFAGSWEKEDPLEVLTPDSLQVREGCAVVLKRRPDGAFEGGTVRNGCESRIRGASYATSEVIVQPDRIVSWDRGFDESGTQVWGATAGGYVFLRVETSIKRN
jgi:hypothetical protein